jgi:predicted phosphate transport protein (TIGR00153 family)
LSSRKLLSWFENRRKSNTLNLAQQQIEKAIYTVTELNKAVKAYSEGNMEETDRSIERLFLQQIEVDNLRRAVFEELTKGSLPPRYRQDLMLLIRRLDRLADSVKDSARSVKVLMEATIPKEVWESYVNVSNDLVECSIALGDCIEMLGQNPLKAKELAKKVDSIEARIDEGYLRTKALFLKYSKKIEVATLMELRDLAEFMEIAADICADTADYIRILATAAETT